MNNLREIPLITAQYINIFLTNGHPRSLVAKKNIILSFALKGTSIAISLILVPLTINYVTPTNYGIWLTLSSIVIWLSFFDIGFGNGLRNKLAEALAENNVELARIYVSTTYAILSIVIGIVLILFIIINSYLNWSKILNSPPEMESELSILALIIFVFFCLRFIFQLITIVLIAKQESAKASSLDLIANVLSLVLIYLLTINTSGNLIYLGVVLSLTPAITLLFSSIFLYKSEYKCFAPSFKHIKFIYAKNLMSLGIRFFIIQIAAIILFNTNNIIIIHLLGSKEVTTYNVAFKLFSITTMIFNIIATPLWSAYTDAYAKNDFDWIQSTMLSMKKIFLMMIFFTGILLITSPFIFKKWLGDSIQVPFIL